jgi:thiol-disulfide isomerase/thioredoxin
MLRQIFFYLFFASIAMQIGYSQNNTRTISGLVTSFDDAAPLEGVQVSVKGSKRMSGSQIDGVYYIQITDKDSALVFSLGEFQPQEIKLSKVSEYNISLRRSNIPRKEPVSENPGFSTIGSWRAIFQLRPDVEVPINFEIGQLGKAELRAYFLNGTEKFESSRVKQTADSLFISLDQFDNELAFAIQGNALNGVLRRQDNSGIPLPVRAETGKNYRFAGSSLPPARDISGTYDVLFKSENGKEEKAVGLFRQEGSKISGTFLHITGDSRYLEGLVEGDHFYLSSFIGSGPSYYKGSFTKDGQVTGEAIGARGEQTFIGVPNENAALPDPYTLTFLKTGYTSFDFSFPDINGKKISLKDEKFKNKVVVVTIAGTWCPNCVDEAAFLAPWYKANKSRGVEVVTIHFERQTEPDFVKKVLTRFQKRYDIQYEQLFGGIADKQLVAASLPSLNTFLAFPTTIIIDKGGKVARIHTGFTGPATGKYYEQFVKDFNQEIDSLVAQ